MTEHLTPAQKAALIAICRTNGGGVRVAAGTQEHNYGVPTQQPYRALWDKDLIQGKASHAYMAVHTRKGWETYKALIND
jgi:hypothetical protein